MSLTVLTDGNVKSLLENLTTQEVKDMQKSLREALHVFSTGTQADDACASHQPERTSLKSAGGTTTLFMPSSSSAGIGMKVVSLVAPSAGAKSTASGDATPRGALTIMASNGQPTGFLNAEEVTAFRTALASSLLVSRRSRLKTLTVFGAGKQAFWHIRIALSLRGNTIKTVNIINRTFSDRAKNFMKMFYQVDSDVKAREGWSNTKFSILTPAYGEYARLVKDQLRAADVIFTTVPSTVPLFDHTILTSHEGRRKGRLIIGIGSYQPHMIEIPQEILLQAVKAPSDHRHFHKHAEEGGVVVVDTLNGCLKEAGEIIQSSLSPMQLVEIGELVMLEGQVALPVVDDDDELDLEKLKVEASSGSSSMASVFREDSGGSGSRTPSRKSSLTRLVRSSSSSARSEKNERSSSTDGRKGAQKQDTMTRWLSEGNVVYKSVGLGLMDLVVGGDLIKLAKSKGVGTTIPNF